jgi:uncharacterized protein YrrD
VFDYISCQNNRHNQDGFTTGFDFAQPDSLLVEIFNYELNSKAMKHSIKDILDYKVITSDDLDGNAKDILFDQHSWIIRYLEVDFGNIFNDRKVLLPRFLMRDSFVTEDRFLVDANKSDIDACPKPDQHLPISRKYEEELHSYYRLDYYWDQPNIAPVDPVGGPSYPFRVPAGEVDEENLGTNLRSFREVKGYAINAVDGKLGNIADLLFDDSNWRILYAVVNTGNWLSWKKKVLLDISWIDRISYTQKEAVTSLTMDAIKNSPEYDPKAMFDERYESTFHDYYERNMNFHRR